MCEQLESIIAVLKYSKHMAHRSRASSSCRGGALVPAGGERVLNEKGFLTLSGANDQSVGSVGPLGEPFI